VVTGLLIQSLKASFTASFSVFEPEVGNDFCAEHFHSCDIGSLSLDIDFSHINNAFQSQKRAGCSGGNAVLSGSGFGNDSVFPRRFANKTCPKALLILCAPVWLRSSLLNKSWYCISA
jgi:hypothetical protein